MNATKGRDPDSSDSSSLSSSSESRKSGKAERKARKRKEYKRREKIIKIKIDSPYCNHTFEGFDPFRPGMRNRDFPSIRGSYN